MPIPPKRATTSNRHMIPERYLWLVSFIVCVFMSFGGEDNKNSRSTYIKMRIFSDFANSFSNPCHLWLSQGHVKACCFRLPQHKKAPVICRREPLVCLFIHSTLLLTRDCQGQLSFILSRHLSFMASGTFVRPTPGTYSARIHRQAHTRSVARGRGR